MPMYIISFEVAINGKEAPGNMEVEEESLERALETAQHKLEEENTNDNVVLLEISGQEI